MAVRSNRIATFAYGDGKSETFNLITLKKLRRLIFSFVGSLAVAGGTTDGTLVQDGLLRTVLNILRVSVNGRRPIDVNGVLPFWYRAILTGSSGVLVNPAVTVGNNACRFAVTLDMDSLRSAARISGRVNMDIQQQAFLELETAAAEGGIVTGGDRTETLTGSLEIIGEYDDVEWKGGHRVLSKDRYVIAGASQDARIIIPSGQLIAGILLYAVDNGARDDDIVNRAKVQVGEDDIRRDKTWEAIQEQNVEDYGLELVAGAPPYTGVAYINLDVDGDMDPAKLLDTRKLVSNSARLTLDVGAPTGTSYVDVMFVGVDPKAKP
jgi:hypothetical protein